MAIIWSAAVSVSGSAVVARAGPYCRVQITTLPPGGTSTVETAPQYRGIGYVTPMVDTYHGVPQAIVYQLTEIGPLAAEVDGLYYSFGPGVIAAISWGSDLMATSQPSGLLAITSTHALADGIATTITWQGVEGGTGQMPELADLRKMKIPAAGLYLSIVTVSLPPATYTDLHIRMLLTGVAFRTLSRETPSGANPNGLVRTVALLIPCSLNEEYTVNVQQSSGASRNLDTWTRWSMARIADL